MLLQCFSSSNIHQHRPIKRTVPGLRKILFKSSLKKQNYKDWNGSQNFKGRHMTRVRYCLGLNMNNCI